MNKKIAGWNSTCFLKESEDCWPDFNFLDIKILIVLNNFTDNGNPCINKHKVYGDISRCYDKFMICIDLISSFYSKILMRYTNVIDSDHLCVMENIGDV